MGDKANYVGTTEIEEGTVQHQGSHRFIGGQKFKIVDETDSTKSVIFNLSGLPTATETEFTIPDSDSSLVTLTAAQSLTNKALDDTTTTFFDTAAPTKVGRFELSGVTAGQTRVMTWPNFDGTLATLAGTETLQNKTLTSPTLSGTMSGGTVAPTTLTVPASTTLTTPVLSGTVTGTNVDVNSTGDLSLTATGGTADIVATSGRNVDINAGATGYIQLTATDGDIGLTTNGSADDIILSAASNGSTVYINSSLRLDRQAQAGTGNATWRSILGVTDTSSAVAITVPAAINISGAILIVKDESGAANVNNITITPASGTIDGAANQVINTAYGVVRWYGNGTNWFSF